MAILLSSTGLPLLSTLGLIGTVSLGVGGGSGSMSITQITQSEIVAPAGVWFEISSISGFDVSEGDGTEDDPSQHDIDWIWDFDDEGTFETTLNVPTSWNNKNVDYGKKVYHVFDTPGTYTVSVMGYDRSGNTGLQTAEVVVQDPDTLYATTRTICVGSDFTGKPTGAQEVSTLAAAKTALEALGATGRILMRAGEDFSGQSITLSNSMDNFRVGSFGAGAKPVMKAPQGASRDVGANFAVFTFGNTLAVADTCFYGLRFEGEWDAAKETGDPRYRPFENTARNGGAFNELVYQCEFDGLQRGPSYEILTNFAYTAAIVDCDITNWQDYGTYNGQIWANIANQRMAIVGTSIHQKLNACRNGQGKINLGNDHGPSRQTDTQQFIMSCVDLYSANSHALVGVQPPLRIAQSADEFNDCGTYFYEGYYNRICAEGGNIGGADAQNDNSSEQPHNFSYRHFIFAFDWSSDGGFIMGHGGVSMENGLIILPVVTGVTSGIANYINFTQDGPGFYSSENAASRMDIRNVTYLNMRTGGVTANYLNESAFTNRLIENNVRHEPNASFTTFAPISIASNISGFQLRNPGERVSVQKVSTGGVSVADDATVNSAYPSGTSASDFTDATAGSTAVRHTVKIGSNYYFSYKGDFDISFGGSNITITNRSGETWSGTMVLGLEQDTLATDSRASTAAVPLPVPQSGSSAFDPESGTFSKLNPITLEDRPAGDQSAGFAQG